MSLNRSILLQICICFLISFNSLHSDIYLGNIEDRDILLEAKANFEKSTNVSTELPLNGLKWEDALLRIRHFISTATEALPSIHYGQCALGFDHRGSLSPSLASIYETSLASEFPDTFNTMYQVGDSPYSLSTLYYNGRFVSDVYYCHYRYVLLLSSFVKNPKIICEIGSGYGALARLWMVNPIASPQIYVLLDYPESLFFADNFLRANLKTIQILIFSISVTSLSIT